MYVYVYIYIIYIRYIYINTFVCIYERERGRESKHGLKNKVYP